MAGAASLITVVLWWWGDRYSVDHLYKMRSMLSRHLSVPHTITVISDRPMGIPSGMTFFNISETLLERKKKLHNNKRLLTKNCMRRMWLYSQEADRLGERLLQLDIDMVLTDSIDPLVNRPEPFVIWKGDSTKQVTNKVYRPHGWAYNATIMLLNPGSRRDVWDRWFDDPIGIYKESRDAGWDPDTNSDQAIATYLLHEREPVAHWTSADGIHAYRGFAGKYGEKDKGLPAGARVVSFHGMSGARTPEKPELQERSPWIRQHWC